MAKQTTKKQTAKKPELVKVRMLKDKYVGNPEVIYQFGKVYEVTADTARIWTNPNKQTAERV